MGVTMTRTLMRHPVTVLGAEALLAVCVYALYSALRVLVEGNEAAAVDRAFQIIAIEQDLGLFHEASIQQAVYGQPWLAGAMRWVYLWAYMPGIVVAAAIIYARERPLYRAYRNTFFLCLAIGLLFFSAMPVAPPRMLPEYGFIDTVHEHIRATSGAKNDFAAVPSFHFGFTLLAALAVSHAFRFRPWVTALTALFPAVMLLSIVSTANHFFLDAAVGAAVVGAAWWLCVGRIARDAQAPRRASPVTAARPG